MAGGASGSGPLGWLLRSDRRNSAHSVGRHRRVRSFWARQSNGVQGHGLSLLFSAQSDPEQAERESRPVREVAQRLGDVGHSGEAQHTDRELAEGREQPWY